MTGIAAGLAALGGVAFGWWAVVFVVILAIGNAAIRGDRQSAAAAILIVTVAAVGAWRAGTPDRFGQSGAPEAVGWATIVSPPVQTGQRQHFVAVVATSNVVDAYRVCVTTGPLPAARIGDEIEMRGTLAAATDESAGVRSMLVARGCEASLYATSISIVGSSPGPARWLAEARRRIGEVLRRAAPGDAGVLLTGLVTGDDEGFSPDQEQAFRKTNTTHLTAVSGSNLALVAGMMATIGAATLGRYRFGWQALTIAAVWAYAAISGAQPPAVRAAVVATAAILAFRFGRRADFPTLILLAAGTMVLVDPRQIGKLGFQLSVAASLALAVVFVGLLRRERGPVGLDIVVATIAAQLATLPFLLPVFGTVSLISVPANTIIAPLAALAMPLAAVAGLAGLIWAPLGEAVAAPASLLAELTLRIVDLLGAAPGYVVVGTPPRLVTSIIAVTVVAILATISGDGAQLLARTWTRRHEPGPSTDGISALGDPAAILKRHLPSPALAVLGGEHPADALRTDPHYPKEEPASQEECHELTDKGECGEAVLGDVGRHAQIELTGDDRNDNPDQDQRSNEHLAALANEGNVVAAEKVEPLEL